MAYEIKGNVPPPMAMPDEVRTLRERAKVGTKGSQMPLPIRIFVGYCFLRAGLSLIFALIVGILPESDAAAYVAARFDPFSHELPPEALFYIQTVLYALVGWRWIRGDWRARWGAMFISGATGVRALIWLLADHFAGDPIPTTPEFRAAVTLGILVNLLLCGFLAFYPGMEQSFRERPWK